MPGFERTEKIKAAGNTISPELAKALNENLPWLKRAIAELEAAIAAGNADKVDSALNDLGWTTRSTEGAFDFLMGLKPRYSNRLVE